MSSVPSNLIPTRITQLPEAPVADPAGYFPIVISGTTYKVQFSQISSNVQVPASRVINAGTGLTGGGSLSADITIAVANGGIGDAQLDTTGVSAGTYGDGTNVPVVTVNTVGRVTSLSTTPLVISGYVPDSRQIVAGSGLSGGGNLDQDRTLAIDFSSATPEPLGAATAGTGVNAAREDHVHPAVDLSDGNETTGELPMSRGGTGANLSPIAGAVVYSNGTNFDLSTAGSNGQVLTSTGGGAPTWTTITGIGTVTSVDGSGGTTGLTVSGGPITAAGTLTLGGTLAISAGGTGLAGTPTNGQLLIGNGSGYALSALTAGTGVSVTNATGSISIASTAPDQTVTLTDGTAISVTGTYPSFTVTNSLPDQTVVLTDGTAISVTGTYPSFTVTNSAPDQTVVITGGGLISVSGTYPSFNVSATEGFSGTVTSIDVSGGTTGLTFSGGPVTDSGTITMAGTLSISAGGTGASTDSGARTALGLGTMAVQDANSVVITGGDISVGSANITTLTSSSVTVSSGATINGGVVVNELGADVDFRIESDTDANAFFLDGATGNVGIGTSSPETGFRLHVVGNAFVQAASGTISKTVIDNADQRLVLGAYFEAGVGQYSFINSTDNAETSALDLIFRAGTTDTMRISSSGNVGIGTASPVAGYRLNVVNDSGNSQQLIRAGTNFNSTIAFGDQDSSTSGQLIYAHNGDYMAFNTNAGERMRIDSSGNVGIGGTANPTSKLNVTGTYTASGGNAFAFDANGTIPSGATTNGIGFLSRLSTQAAAFTCSQISHYYAQQATIGAGSTVTNQFGFYADGTFTGATNNFGFYSGIASGSNRWNFYAAGTAKNYFAGNVGVGVDPGSSPIAAVGAAGANAVYKLFSPSGYGSFLLMGVNGGSLGEFSVDTSGNISISTNGVAAGVVRVTRASSVSDTMTVDAGEVRIGNNTDNGAYNLQCNGTGVWGAGAYVNGSDARLKDNIQSLDAGLDVVKAMRPVTFQYKPEYSKDQSVQPGFIAQELQTAMAGKPYLEGVVQEGPNHLNVAYQNIIPILVKAIQELEDKVAALEAK